MHPATYYYFSILCCHFILDCNGQKLWPQSLLFMGKIIGSGFYLKGHFLSSSKPIPGSSFIQNPFFMLIFMLILCLKSLTVKTQKIHSFFQIILFILGYFPFGAVCCYVISLMQVLSKLFCVFINFECILQPCSIYASSFTLVAISIERLDLKFIIVNVKV